MSEGEHARESTHHLRKEVEGGEVSEAFAAPLFEVHLRDISRESGDCTVDYGSVHDP